MEGKATCPLYTPDRTYVVERIKLNALQKDTEIYNALHDLGITWCALIYTNMRNYIDLSDLLMDVDHQGLTTHTQTRD